MRTVRQQNTHLLGDRVPQRRLGEQGEGLRPPLVVHQVQIPYGDDLGRDGRHRRVGQPVQDVLAPHVHRVQQARVVGFGEVRVPRLQFVRIEDDVGGPHQGEAREHATGGERLFAPAVGQLGVDEGEFVLTHDLGERAAGQHEFAAWA